MYTSTCTLQHLVHVQCTYLTINHEIKDLMNKMKVYTKKRGGGGQEGSPLVKRSRLLVSDGNNVETIVCKKNARGKHSYSLKFLTINQSPRITKFVELLLGDELVVVVGGGLPSS